MRFISLSVMAAAAIMMAGCNKAKSPDAVAKDVAAAQQSGAKEVSNSEDAAAKNLNKAADKVDDKLSDFDNQAAKDAYNVELAKADAKRKVAEANCNSQSGDAQKTCKDQAQADYDAAKANAKSAALAIKQ